MIDWLTDKAYKTAIVAILVIGKIKYMFRGGK
jgi:hypothetical protein